MTNICVLCKKTSLCVSNLIQHVFICTIIFSNFHAICFIDFTSKLALFIWDLSKSSNYTILSIALQQSLFQLIVWRSEYLGNFLFSDFKESHITSHYLQNSCRQPLERRTCAFCKRQCVCVCWYHLHGFVWTAFEFQLKASVLLAPQAP